MKIRLVPEGTAIYFKALRSSWIAASLRDGLAFSIALETVAVEALKEGTPPWRGELTSIEREALENLDIPLLTIDWRTTAATMRGHTVPDVVAESGSRAVQSPLSRVGDRNTGMQRAIAQVCLEARIGDRVDAATDVAGSDELEAARTIGESLVESMADWRDGTVRWINVSVSDVISGAPYASVSGDGLYEGNAGIAVFLAAMAGIEDDDGFERAARRARRPHRWEDRVRPGRSGDRELERVASCRGAGGRPRTPTASPGWPWRWLASSR